MSRWCPYCSEEGHESGCTADTYDCPMCEHTFLYSKRYDHKCKCTICAQDVAYPLTVEHPCKTQSIIVIDPSFTAPCGSSATLRYGDHMSKLRPLDGKTTFRTAMLGITAFKAKPVISEENLSLAETMRSLHDETFIVRPLWPILSGNLTLTPICGSELEDKTKCMGTCTPIFSRVFTLNAKARYTPDPLLKSYTDAVVERLGHDTAVAEGIIPATATTERLTHDAGVEEGTVSATSKRKREEDALS